MPQHIAVDHSWIFSGYSFLKETALSNHSLLTKSIKLFQNINSGTITIIFSILLSIISIINIYIHGKNYKLNITNISILLCFLFLVDNLRLYNDGLNYPLSILKISQNTSGQFGFIFSLLTIGVINNNYRTGLVFIIFNLFIHPTLGMLTIAFICLKMIIRKKYSLIIIPILIIIIFLFYNSSNIGLDNSHAIKFIYNIDSHRAAITLIDLKFLLVPIIFTICISRKKFVVSEWIFLVLCLVISFAYYNYRITPLQYEFLALMPSRGVNIAASLIIIKYFIDTIKHPTTVKLIVPMILSFFFTPGPSNAYLFFLAGYFILIIYFSSNLFSKIIKQLNININWRLKSNYLLLVFIGLVAFNNFMRSEAFYPKQGYDIFFKNKNGYILDFTYDYSIMVRNKGIEELLPMGLMDGYCYNPSGLNEANKIFKKLFKTNLWDLEINLKAGRIQYEDVKLTIENYNNEDWVIFNDLELKYIVAPSNSKINLDKVWDDGEKVVYKIS